MEYPEEVVARAEFEINTFDRPSVATSLDLIRTVKALREELALTRKCVIECEPVSDTIHPGKKLAEANEIARSLINLRDEIAARPEVMFNRSSDLLEMLFKINSCLYRKYPT